MDEPLKIFEYTYNEGEGFKMETIASLYPDKDITSITRSRDLVLFEFKQDLETNILNTHKSSKQLSGTIATLQYKVSDLVPQQSISASQKSNDMVKSKTTYKTLKGYFSKMVGRNRLPNAASRLAGKKRTRRTRIKKE
jgi:hypothetical protein